METRVFCQKDKISFFHINARSLHHKLMSKFIFLSINLINGHVVAPDILHNKTTEI